MLFELLLLFVRMYIGLCLHRIFDRYFSTVDSSSNLNTKICHLLENPEKKLCSCSSVKKAADSSLLSAAIDPTSCE